MKARVPHPEIHDSDVNMICKRRRFIAFSLTMAILIISIPHVYYHLTWIPSEAAKNSSEEKDEADISSEDRDLAVIILANHRTGSSMTGELLSLAKHASYFFEPIYYTKNVLADPSIEAQLFVLRSMIECDGDLMATILTESSVHIIRRLDGQRVRKDRGLTAKELRQMCRQSPLRIIKTIRLRLSAAQALISDMAASSVVMPKVKIIHLVRDPRAMLSSVNAVTLWGGAEKKPANQCNALTADLKLGRTLPKSQYLLLRFEDLVESPLPTLKKIFDFMEADVPTEPVTKYLDEHMHAEKHSKMVGRAGEFFLTIRNSSFDVNHWQKEITPEFLAEVEAACKVPLAELNYRPYLQNVTVTVTP